MSSGHPHPNQYYSVLNLTELVLNHSTRHIW